MALKSKFSICPKVPSLQKNVLTVISVKANEAVCLLYCPPGNETDATGRSDEGERTGSESRYTTFVEPSGSATTVLVTFCQQ
jgi:hypothetical protein